MEFHMFRKKVCSFFVFFLLIIASSTFAGDPNKISETATEPLRRMCNYLSSLPSFSLKAENSMEVVLDTGQKLHFHRTVELSVRRPNKVRADINGDRVNQQFYYDGKTLTIYGLDTGFYATEAAPPEIDAAMDFALEAFNLTAPMAELIYNSSYEKLTQEVKSGYLIGESNINGFGCLHLAFRQENLDWQIWIENDPEHPFPRKVIITDTQKEKFPQFTAEFGNWNPNASFPDEIFVFVQPEDAKKIEFLPKKNPDKTQ